MNEKYKLIICLFFMVLNRIPLNEGINLNAIGDSGTLSVEYVTIPSQVQAIPGRNSEATQEAIILVPAVPPMGKEEDTGLEKIGTLHDKFLYF